MIDYEKDFSEDETSSIYMRYSIRYTLTILIVFFAK